MLAVPQSLHSVMWLACLPLPASPGRFWPLDVQHVRHAWCKHVGELSTAGSNMSPSLWRVQQLFSVRAWGLTWGCSAHFAACSLCWECRHGGLGHAARCWWQQQIQP